MAREVARGQQPDPVHMRAADADRQKVAEQLKVALDEGRLTLHEYDDRVARAYGARTYADLLNLLTDLPAPGLNADEVVARRRAEQRKQARKLPMALMVLWTIWAALTVVNVVVYGLIAITITGDEPVYVWPVWMAVPGAALLAVTIGVQVMRHRDI